jgi:hypothetical protein
MNASLSAQWTDVQLGEPLGGGLDEAACAGEVSGTGLW